uniref:Antitoxin n=1 Tax=viral metagenome TaxID=1070528 RepID=A0A6M3MCC2_9ZZZZ
MSKDIQLKDVDPELHREFKTACSHFGISMKDVIVKHMQNIINDYRKDKAGFLVKVNRKSKWRRK